MHVSPGTSLPLQMYISLPVPLTWFLQKAKAPLKFTRILCILIFSWPPKPQFLLLPLQTLFCQLRALPCIILQVKPSQGLPFKKRSQTYSHKLAAEHDCDQIGLMSGPLPPANQMNKVQFRSVLPPRYRIDQATMCHQTFGQIFQHEKHGLKKK